PGDQLPGAGEAERATEERGFPRVLAAAPQREADPARSAADAGDRRDPAVGRVPRVEEMAPGGLERAKGAAEHRLADVAVLEVALPGRALVAVLRPVERLLGAVVDAGDAERGELDADRVGDLQRGGRQRVVGGEAALAGPADHVVVVEDGD